MLVWGLQSVLFEVLCVYFRRRTGCLYFFCDLLGFFRKKKSKPEKLSFSEEVLTPFLSGNSLSFSALLAVLFQTTNSGIHPSLSLRAQKAICPLSSALRIYSSSLGAACSPLGKQSFRAECSRGAEHREANPGLGGLELWKHSSSGCSSARNKTED